MFRTIVAAAFFWFASLSPLLAKEAEGSAFKSGLAWGLVILCVVLGMLVTLQPVKRIMDIKGRKE